MSEMSEMIERVAEGIKPMVLSFMYDELPPNAAEQIARAAIEAMREPTENMRKIDPQCFEAMPYEAALYVWQAMIDAAISEDQPANSCPTKEGEIYLHLTAEQMHHVISGNAWIELTAEQRAVLKPANARADPAQS